MSTRRVSLRELVIADCARTARRSGYASIATLLRRADLTTTDLEAASADLAHATARPRAAGKALSRLVCGALFAEDARPAAEILSAYCGLELAAWLAETCAEQGVELDEEVGV